MAIPWDVPCSSQDRPAARSLSTRSTRLAQCPRAPRKSVIDKAFREHGRMGPVAVQPRVAACADARAVRTARARVRQTDGDTLRLMAEIAAIPAPTGREGERAAFMDGVLRAAALHTHV